MASEYLYPPKPAPALDIPPGASVKVQIIDTTARIQAPVEAFMYPEIPGHQFLQAPAFSFLVEQVSTGRKILFDLGCRKDWQNFPPVIQNTISSPGWKLDIQKSVSEILQENGVDAAAGAIEAIVWSHWHFDHTGDPSLFPSSTAVIAGPGMKEALLPGYPINPESPLLESDLKGREHKSIDFNNSPTLKIGQFRAVDYFNDGSFYLLDSPGHAIGHVCGLARVTSTLEGDKEDTFIFMGADTAHHGGEFRPTQYLPLPKDIKPSPFTGKYPTSCPGHIFETIHPSGKGSEPFYRLQDRLPHSLEQAEESCSHMQEFDAAENVFVIIAHDATLLDEQVGIEWFPHGTLKNWKEKDCARKARWAFLKDFGEAVEAAQGKTQSSL
jgi:glyoxylase-like metal-dependent hydrolase (beta-lactamase superfamily II)